MAGIALAEPAVETRPAPLAAPHPPGTYPVVIVGSGPGGLQTGYCLSRLGIGHAILSQDDAPGGMFRRFPLFQRLITWTKPHAPVEVGTREYERYDWNSLLGAEPATRAIVPPLMEGTSYFPSRPEMEMGLVAFAERAPVEVRYGCRWEATRREDNGFVVETSEGEYRCRVLILAVGMTEAWKPDIPGLDAVPHYVDVGPPEDYTGKRVFIMGKRNSGFEIADGLLSQARKLILGSPRPAQLSVFTHSTAAARARYIQPYEDFILGGGTLVLDAAIERIERTRPGFTVYASGTTAPGEFVFEVDDVIAATGFGTPLGDLPDLGVKTFYKGRLPAQTPFWESATVPGIYFAGSVTQGAIGLKKYGLPSASAAVHGFRYNARVLARHVAQTRFGVEPERKPVPARGVLDLLLAEISGAPEIWNQQSYLARVISFREDLGILDDGVEPLAHFVDAAGPDAVAVTIETDDNGDIHPCVYVRRSGHVAENTLESNPLLEFATPENRSHLAALLGGLVD